MRSSRVTSRRFWVAALIALFAFRLLFGLSSRFFGEDETQIFLIGLRYYATGQWPYFGPDVVWTKSVIPGALQGLMVGWPLRIIPVPEAPIVWLNILSYTALAWLAWYVTRRLTTIPRWLVWGWLMTLPWTLQFSTRIINPSYLLPASVVFFVGFFEAVPIFRVGIMPPWLAFACMGAAATWSMQFHMQWPLLMPYAALAWVARKNDGARLMAASAAAFVLGALVPALALVPTLVRFGPGQGSGGTLNNIHVHFVSPEILVSTLARLFSFASLEIARFIETDAAKRLTFFERHLWLLPLAIVVWAAGIVQPLWMLRVWFKRQSRYSEWWAIRALMASTVLLVYVSFWFVMEPAQAHSFYVLAPVAFVYAAYCWTFLDSPRWRTAAATLLAANIAFHLGLAVAQAPEKSLYKNRGVVVAALRDKAPQMFAHRRPFAIEGGPATLSDPGRGHDPARDIVVNSASASVGRFGVVVWDVALKNANPRVAFRDVLYYSKYLDASGALLEQRHEFIRDILQPGESWRVQLNDGFVRVPFARATFEVVAAEALLPAFEGSSAPLP